MSPEKRTVTAVVAIGLILLLSSCSAGPTGPITERVDITRGICVLLGDENAAEAIELARATELLIYVQLETDEAVEAARQAVDAEGLYGNRIWVDKGAYGEVHLGNNLADVLVAVGGAADEISDDEALRVVCPRGKALLGGSTLVKPALEGADDWSHPYHGPDNNPMSLDTVAKAPYLTQFLAKPYYAPLTQVAVASDGRLFKAFGNIAFHEREEALLNSLVAFNGYNGTMLWRRRLTPGVMIHRNTMIATPEVLYVGDDKSCKRIDTATGQLIDEIVPPEDVAGGTFWKWMALQDGVLYALVGEQEQNDPVTKQRRQAHGWPWDPLTRGFNQDENPWGFGHNLLAIDIESKRVLWSHHEEEQIDSRALCMKGDRIYIYRHGTYLAALDSGDGETVWRKTPEDAVELFAAIGPALPRQDWRTNWRTTNHMKCSDDALYFAGPAVGKLLAVSAKDASVLWEHPYDNFQLVLRDDGLYAISGQIDEKPSLRFDPLTGEILSTMDTHRRACARPNGSADAIFFRARGGSVRLDMDSEKQQWVSPMRAQCNDGVTIANGLLYWWPSVCDCQNTLYGLTSLGPAGEDFDFSRKATPEERLEVSASDLTNVASFAENASDWTTFRADNNGTATTQALIATDSTRLWWKNPATEFVPTPPVTAGGLVFLGGSDGIVRAMDIESGEPRWKAYTGGSIRYPPTVWQGRVYAGSGDGWVYTYEAATGRLLWRFNAAPANRKIPVYDSLMSTWPVASGVLIEDGVAYFAAGIVNYDGTHVYALDAKSGQIVWQNNTSGHLDAEARTGVSVQGHLMINDGKLFLAGGTSVSPAVYDLKTGECLNDPAPLKLCVGNDVRGEELYKVGNKVIASGKPMYSDPHFPVYDASVSNRLLHTSANGRDVLWLNNRKLLGFPRIDRTLLEKSVAQQFTQPVQFVQAWNRMPALGRPVWERDSDGSVAFARGKNAVLVAGTREDGGPRIDAVDLASGKNLWRRPMQLHTPPVAWGLAVDSEGRIVAALADGQVMCFGPAPAETDHATD